jgi:hypothetical protein
MLKGIRSRLSYANVMATGAMFVALGGGAYALNGVPDRGGVYHGCVDGKTRTLRVVTDASSCRKAKIVRRNGRRVRITGESAIAWNQLGRPGANGTDGLPGTNGKDGANGATKVVVRTGTSVLNAGLAGRATANCIGNERAVGGSATSSNTALNDWIIDSEPVNGNGIAASTGDTPVGWSTQMHGDGTQGTKMVIAYVICASP